MLVRTAMLKDGIDNWNYRYRRFRFTAKRVCQSSVRTAEQVVYIQFSLPKINITLKPSMSKQHTNACWLKKELEGNFFVTSDFLRKRRPRPISRTDVVSVGSGANSTKNTRFFTSSNKISGIRSFKPLWSSIRITIPDEGLFSKRRNPLIGCRLWKICTNSLKTLCIEILHGIYNMAA